MKAILDRIENIRAAAESALRGIDTHEALEAFRVRFLGKKGELTELLRGMGSADPAERPKLGAAVNSLREHIEGVVSGAKSRIDAAALDREMVKGRVDVTLPGTAPAYGTLHPLTQTMNLLIGIFRDMGYSVLAGPEIETDYYNFEALNIPKHHPARDMQDTFYITGDILLRTQTSTMQIRHLQQNPPPVRIIAPGRVYRDERGDATHGSIFHQVEGLCVDKGITMGDLKGTLDVMCKRLFGEQTRTRLRPSYFPFTEPSAEVDISCPSCDAKGCNICKGEGWIELLGAGMVHRKVLRNCGVDPDVYSGFAFGLGIERAAMRRFGINDLRLLYENDARFLSQFY